MEIKRVEKKRRCKQCGNVWTHRFVLAGIPRCPNCYGTEYDNVEYINSKGEVIGSYRKSLVYTPPKVDNGCPVSNDYSGRAVGCNECGFSKCIEDLEDTDKSNIRQWRQILKAYEMADKKISPLQISRRLGVSRYLVNEWLAKRDFYEWFLRRPVIVGGK